MLTFAEDRNHLCGEPASGFSPHQAAGQAEEECLDEQRRQDGALHHQVLQPDPASGEWPRNSIARLGTKDM